jgi:hypothetical protein
VIGVLLVGLLLIKGFGAGIEDTVDNL